MADDVWTSAVLMRCDAEVGSVRDARRFVADALDDLEDGRASDAALLTSELATNAVIHAQSPYVVTVRRGHDRIRVEVADHSPAEARRNRYSAMSGTGRGLAMVEQLATAWGSEVAVSGAGKVVWFELVRARSVGEGGDDDVATSDASADAGSDVAPDLDAILAELGGDGGAPDGRHGRACRHRARVDPRHHGRVAGSRRARIVAAMASLA